ncbi:F-box/LRR-repeat protein 8-like isoform X2 [Anneissia japonica]|nr:F-box/LRR-repeat protein 8-like isoform X2 [Anneissia japonica]XP_033109995.1 F-box/LRR-repeat protein 8-like isoform X2 [Anneissia japonica]XP_033109996.1 F-box/LRR-repeat protein 8-like isoform X2 [Anneissia japonica]XP_033109997.1 F-box/LRR-repeat protein 8-like isoform X2 [Anneissia japonica]
MDYSGISWSTLPEHILVTIFSYLPISDRFHAAVVCKGWQDSFNSPYLWHSFKFSFIQPSDSIQLKFLEKYGRHLRHVEISCDQTQQENCSQSCQVLTHLARTNERRLESIAVHFIKENPLFFRGDLFLCSLAELFGPTDPKTDVVNTLKSVILARLAVTFEDVLLNLLADNHSTIHTLNIQNVSLTCSISSHCMLNFVEKCRQLQRLSCHYKSLSKDVFEALATPKRKPLKFLSIACTRENKYHMEIPESSWESLVQVSPDLVVNMKFDHTIEKHRIRRILCYVIPLTQLSMTTMTELHEEVQLAADFFHATLEKLVITTKGSPDLKRELLRLVSMSSNLKVLHCFCALDPETISRIQVLRPQLTDTILRTAEEFEEEGRTLIGREATSSIIMGP